MVKTFMSSKIHSSLFVLLFISFCFPTVFAMAQSNKIVFVTQLPLPQDFGTLAATFNNHRGGVTEAGRGGDLYIRYPDGSLKNLTASAGFGNNGFQGDGAIAVRDPAVHWSGEKVIFSMVVGAPTEQYEVDTYYWQLYEVINLGKNENPVITKVPLQPEEFNNVNPIYGTDGRIIFASDRPLTGERHLYPQRDEYEATPIVSGLWSLDPESGDLFILDHSPSGDFHPIIDSFGRVIFTRWDHLQRDQENIGVDFGAFNYSSEAENATALNHAEEVFPEPRTDEDPEYVSSLNEHSFNHFFPWMMFEDGSELETLNHVGRHELHAYIQRSFNNDDNLDDYYQQYSRSNPNPILNFFHIAEDPGSAGRYIGIDAPEFGTHSAGQIVALSAPPELKAGEIEVEYLTHRDTSGSDDTPSGDHIGLSRDPLITTDGIVIASHTSNTREDANIGTTSAPRSRYDFRIKIFTKVGEYYQPGQNLTPGITKTVSFWSPDEMRTFTNVQMWEVQPVEVVSRTSPTATHPTLESPEATILNEKGVSLNSLRSYLRANNLALVVARDMTTRDSLDIQQPFNLRVHNSNTESISKPGEVYTIAHLQFFIGRLIRGYTQAPTGRRVLAQALTELSEYNPPNPTGPSGSVAVGADGSMAAFVPARRALTWQLTDESGKGVVRERYWVTFQPGEVRVCASCHGVTGEDQLGRSTPQNPPEALRELLDHWIEDGGGSGGGSDEVARVTLKAKRKGARIVRFSGKALTDEKTGISTTITLARLRKKGPLTIAELSSDTDGKFRGSIKTTRPVRLRASSGEIHSKPVKIR